VKTNSANPVFCDEIEFNAPRDIPDLFVSVMSKDKTLSDEPLGIVSIRALPRQACLVNGTISCPQSTEAAITLASFLTTMLRLPGASASNGHEGQCSSSPDGSRAEWA
jgi:hypothetical protein